MIDRKVFISSTIYDLASERANLKDYLKNLPKGPVLFTPVMSEFVETFMMQPEDLMDQHSYEVCMDKVNGCDYLVLIVNKNYHAVDWSRYPALAQRFKAFLSDDYSITENEYLRARNLHIPCLVFINKQTIEARRKHKKGEPQSYISSKELGIFDFIDRINSQPSGNWREEYETVNDIEEKLLAILSGFDDFRLVEEDPEGRPMHFLEEYTHSWKIENTGNVTWENRKLVCLNSLGNDLSITNSEIAIPTLQPGESCVLQASFKASNREGLYSTEWVISNEAGLNCFNSTINNVPKSLFSSVVVIRPPHTKERWREFWLRDKPGFIGEFPPDNKTVGLGEKFSHTWTLHNRGNTVWEGRYVECLNPLYGLHVKESRIDIPTTKPGGTADIAATFTAPNRAGTFFSYWKMRNADGSFPFPDKRSSKKKLDNSDKRGLSITVYVDASVNARKSLTQVIHL